MCRDTKLLCGQEVDFLDVKPGGITVITGNQVISVINIVVTAKVGSQLGKLFFALGTRICSYKRSQSCHARGV
jgi:hypothetical protein